eukprot:1159774-Pelagomonas_calceolata.AAC.12
MPSGANTRVHVAHPGAVPTLMAHCTGAVPHAQAGSTSGHRGAEQAPAAHHEPSGVVADAQWTPQHGSHGLEGK